MKKFFQEFGAFISRGNALDLAVGLVIGTAFNAIIKSLVNDIIMPLISLIGGKDVGNWFAVLRGTATYDLTSGAWVFSADAVVLRYGAFIQAIIDFLIIALAIFLALKVIMGFRKKLDEVKAKLVHKEPEAEKK
ncbi:MAG TPA: large conductance mechanosensitive channel protein MscL [Candidatus Izemoplasmatales bacterium]|nr:large conductance mechanosensitive channel protein MscL [Bacillota bacterium]HRY78561.1 large conductance mechanosensitive channel protein MscL [Candidatus Izemoplasmatales bacterium]